MEIIREQGGWPLVLELNVGETAQFRLDGETHYIQVLSLTERFEPDYWITGNEERRTFAEARLELDVSGVRDTLFIRPYEMPKLIGGLRVYGELVKMLVNPNELVPIGVMNHDVRLSIRAEGEPWGPDDWIFPIANYRWHANSYGNTWNSLVPYNQLYHHRGEDYGAIPDLLEVIAPHDGIVVRSPVPTAKDSNRIAIEAADGWQTHLSHMNIETIAPEITAGARVKRGQYLGKTGSTWRSERRQHSDPHLHISSEWHGNVFSYYPFIVEAYWRSYSDSLLAIAGRYRFTIPLSPVTLDGSRSIARPGKTITRYLWTLHTGEEIEGPIAKLHYDAPGIYSEELRVFADDGSEDRDYAQVRVYDPEQARDFAFGWFYHYPVRNLHAGDEILFWNRLNNTSGEVLIDYGDGSPEETISDEACHSYAAPGLYTARLMAKGAQGEPAQLATRVVVEG